MKNVKLSEKKDKTLCIRVTSQELEFIKYQSCKYGVAVSDYLRIVIDSLYSKNGGIINNGNKSTY